MCEETVPNPHPCKKRWYQIIAQVLIIVVDASDKTEELESNAKSPRFGKIF